MNFLILYFTLIFTKITLCSLLPCVRKAKLELPILRTFRTKKLLRDFVPILPNGRGPPLFRIILVYFLYILLNQIDCNFNQKYIKIYKIMNHLPFLNFRNKPTTICFLHKVFCEKIIKTLLVIESNRLFCFKF